MKRIICSASFLLPMLTAGLLAAETLTLETAWQQVLGRHPVLAAAEAELEARQADLAQAGKGLNPELAFEMENFAGNGDFDGFDEADFTLTLAQTWELGGQADSRRAVARAGLDAGQTAARTARLELRTGLAQAFVKVLAAQHRLDLADTLLQVATEDRKDVDRRMTAGAENRVEAKLARLAEHSARRNRNRIREELQSLRLALGTFWSEEPTEFPELEGPFDYLHEVPGWTTILSQLESSPRMQRARADIALSRAGVDLAKSEGKVDLTTGLGLRHFRGSDNEALVVSVGLPLPVRDRKHDARRAAEAEVVRSEAEARAAAKNLTARLSEIWRRVDSSHADVEAIRSDILPTADLALEEAIHAFKRGRYSLTDVLIVRRTWAEWQLELVNTLVEHHLAAIELAAVLGVDPSWEVRP